MKWFMIKWVLIAVGTIWVLHKVLPAVAKDWLKEKAKSLWAKVFGKK